MCWFDKKWDCANLKSHVEHGSNSAVIIITNLDI